MVPDTGLLVSVSVAIALGAGTLRLLWAFASRIQRGPDVNPVLPDREEYEEEHIAGAINVPMSQTIERLKEIPADRPKAVLCAGGLRSSSVISALLRAGISGCYNVAGGMREWSKAGYSTVKPGGSQGGA